jgi:hypothetical protein
MQSRQRRAGAPLLFAFGPKVEDGALRVPLLIFSAQLDPLTYDLFDPDDPKVAVRVTLPESILDRPRDAHATHVTLEVA